MGLGPSDVTFSPNNGVPNFEYVPVGNFLRMRSSDGTAVSAEFNVPMPSRYTIDLQVRFPKLPNDVGDLATHAAGITLADDASRGVSIYFAKTGMAISRIDDFGSVTTLPGTSENVREIDNFFHYVRVAVDGGLGRAYVFIGDARGAFPGISFIIPIERTPTSVGDLFKVFCRGTISEPVTLDYRIMRLASGLIIPNFPPTANAGPDRVVPVGRAARLDGRTSFDIEGAPLTYTWRAVDAPFGSDFVFEGPSCSTVPDGADGTTTLVSFPATTLPDWVQPGDVLVVLGGRHNIATVDNPGGTLTVEVDAVPDTLSDQPFRIIRQSLLVGATSETPHVVPDVQGIYRFTLVVGDGESLSETAEVLVNVVGARTPFGIEPDTDFLWEGLGDDWELVEDRGMFSEFWKGTAQILGGKLLEAWQYHYNFSIGDAQPILQRKWLAYKTLVPEEGTASISVRKGLLYGSTPDLVTGTGINGEDLVLELVDATSPTGLILVTVSGLDVTLLDTQLNGALNSYGIYYDKVVTATDVRLWLRSSTVPFRVHSSSTATGLNLAAGWNYLAGSNGALVTDRTYRVDVGIDLIEHGVQREDLLVLNNGQTFRIDRVLSSPLDPAPNQRLLLFDSLPSDASVEWSIPSVVLSDTTDYEREGTYPGDLVKGEVQSVSSGAFIDVRGDLVAQRGMQLAANLGDFLIYLDWDEYELFFLGVKRRKAISLPADVKSVPQLQEVIPANLDPTLWKENIDYYLEPFYREDDESALPMLQWRDSVWIEPDLEPPDILWAELTLLSNDENIQNLFGRLVGFLRENATTFGDDFSYPSAVAGLLYTQQLGPTPQAIKTGAQILFGQPFAEHAGTITEVRADYSPTKGRLVIQDADGNTPTQSEIFRTYIYTKDPLDLDTTSGIEVNPATGVPYAVGDDIEQFAPIGTGVEIQDYINDPDWYIPFVRSGIITELEKFFTFTLSFNLDLVSTVNLILAQQFVLRMRPTYTYPFLLGARAHEDDVDIIDELSMTLTMFLYDSSCPSGRAYMYDDYRGDGTIWSTYDDGATFYDGIVDCISDYIEMYIVFDWPGGPIEYDNTIFFYDEALVPVSLVGGTYVITGPEIFLNYDDNLPVGTYATVKVIDQGNDVLP